MSILPRNPLFVIVQYWSAILQLVSAVWYERQLSRYQNHWLVQLNQIVELQAIEQACAGFHAQSNRGKPVVHTASRLVRSLLIRYLFNRSLRQTEELIDNHLLIKWFVGYGLFDTPPDHSYLNRFELWLFRHQPRLFFDQVIRLIDQLCPEDGHRLQIVDTFGMKARAAHSYLVDLLRDMCRHLLITLAQTDPDRHLALLAQLNLLALFGHQGEKITPALKGQARTERLQQVGQQAFRLSRLLHPSLVQAPYLSADAQAPLRLLLAYLDKILADETIVTYHNPLDPDDVSIVERNHGQKGTYRVGSASDLSATYRKHDNDKQAILGFNPAALTTSVFCREIKAATGAQPDNVDFPKLLQDQYEQHGFFPAQVAGDMKFGYGKTRAQIAQVTNNQTQVIALLPDYDKRSQLYGPPDFTLSDDGLSLTCPNNVTTDRRYLTQGKGGADFRFSATKCRGCSDWHNCRGPDSKKSVPRNVFISFYRPQVEAALEFNQSDAFKQAIKQRMKVERIIYCLTNIYGARQAHSYGLQRADFQLKMQASAFNLRQLVRQMLKKRHAQAAVCPRAA